MKKSVVVMVALVVSAMFAFGSLESKPKRNVCKNLKRYRCIVKSECTWVKVHKRKGRRIAAHCKRKRR